jgi:hypothetical protein
MSVKPFSFLLRPWPEWARFTPLTPRPGEDWTLD